jgi:hypothetical protein
MPLEHEPIPLEPRVSGQHPTRIDRGDRSREQRGEPRASDW